MDTQLLQMALIGYAVERQKIQDKITEIQRQLNGRSRLVGTPAATHTRSMSVAARKRIAAAQRKRWAEYHKKQKAG
jgi:hypothetical protein